MCLTRVDCLNMLKPGSRALLTDVFSGRARQRRSMLPRLAVMADGHAAEGFCCGPDPWPGCQGVASESFLAAGPRLVADEHGTERSADSFASARSKAVSTPGSHAGAP